MKKSLALAGLLMMLSAVPAIAADDAMSSDTMSKETMSKDGTATKTTKTHKKAHKDGMMKNETTTTTNTTDDTMAK